ncbi:hypothetical protein D3C71_1729440 [compost metagenome]
MAELHLLRWNPRTLHPEAEILLYCFSYKLRLRVLHDQPDRSPLGRAPDFTGIPPVQPRQQTAQNTFAAAVPADYRQPLPLADCAG